MPPNAPVQPDPWRTPEFALFTEAHALESLRRAVRRELRVHRGQRALAEIIGVSRGTLRKFVEMRSVPTPANLERIQEWAADRPEMRTPIGAVALAILADQLPSGVRLRLRVALSRVLAATYAEVGEAPPSWVRQELER